MNLDSKEISSPFSGGAGGSSFEIEVQTSFAILLLARSFAPCMPSQPVQEIQLQGRHKGYNTDDFIVTSSHPDGSGKKKLLVQAKHAIRFTESDKNFPEVIAAAWNDFSNSTIFTAGTDSIALVTGPLTITDTQHVRPLLEVARTSKTSEDFFSKIYRTKLFSQKTRDRLDAIERLVNRSNGSTVSQQDVWRFLRHFHLLGYDLDIQTSVLHALFYSMIRYHTEENAAGVWGRVRHIVMHTNQTAGILCRENFPSDLRSLFDGEQGIQMPKSLSYGIAPKVGGKIGLGYQFYANQLAIAMLLGSWSEQSEADQDVLRKLAGGE